MSGMVGIADASAPPLPPPPGIIDSPGKASASSAPPLIRGPPTSAAEASVGVEAPPPPPEMSQALAELPAAPGAGEPERNRSGSRVEQAIARISLPKLGGGGNGSQKTVVRLNIKRRVVNFAKQCPFWYCEAVARFPWAFLILYAMIVVIVISAGWRNLEVNTDLDAFREVAGEAAKKQRSYSEALKNQRAAKDLDSLGDRTTFELQLFYEAKTGSVFQEAALRDIRMLENSLRSLPGWKTMCAMSAEFARFRCEPGESMGNYAWPARTELDKDNHIPFTLDFDGGSRERLPVHAFLTYLHEGHAAPHDLGKFLPHQFGGPREDATILRTIFAFTAPSLDDGSFATAYKEFVAKDLFPALQNATQMAESTPGDEWLEPWSVRLYFRGSEIESHEVRYYLEGDLEWAAGALVVTFIITWLQLRSLFLTIFGLIQVCLVPFMAFVTIQLDDISLATFCAIFLVIGLSSNDLIAVREYWVRVTKDSEVQYPQRHQQQTDASRPPSFGFDKYEMNAYYALRVSRTFQALLFRFLPQFTFMISWLVLLLSLIRPIREFGLFMFVCTAYSCILCVAIFPPLLVLHEIYIKPFVHSRLHWIPAMILEPKNLKLPWRPIVRKCLLLANRRHAMIIWGSTLGVTVIILGITIAVAGNSDTAGLPEVYAPSHHGNAGRPLISAFTPASPALIPASQTALVCELSRTGVYGAAVCPGEPSLHWCEAPQVEVLEGSTTTTPPPSASTKCECHRPPTVAGKDFINQTFTLTGDAFSLTGDDTRMASLQDYVVRANPNTTVTFQGSKGRLAPSLVLEHWESGRTDVEPVWEMPSAVITSKAVTALTRSTSNNTQVLPTVCYCGKRVCARPDGIALDPNLIDLPAPTEPPTPAPTRLLSSVEKLPAVKEVVIVFGILPVESDGFFRGTSAWNFDTTFEPESPWAQRSMLKMCTNIPSSFAVIQSHCWIEQFRTWMLARGEKFPTQRFENFQEQLRKFLKEQNHVPVTAMWVNVEGNMVATAFSFKVPPKPKAPVSEILLDRDAWLAYVKAENDNSATSASLAWATSSSWAEAEAQSEATKNAWDVAGLAIGICVFCCVIYTWDAAFVTIVMIVAMVALTYLAFFMFCIFSWEFGPWEVILMVAYLMYFVEPCLRVGRGTVWGEFLAKETRIAGHSNAVSPVSAPLPPPTSDAPAAIMDDGAPPAIGGGGSDDVETLEGSSNNSNNDLRDQAAARSMFEGRMHQFVLNISNATFGSAVKLILCGMMALPCEFRLFTRLGAVTILVPILTLPCIFLLVPTALVLLPIREKPDLVTLYEFTSAKIIAYRDA